jgi:putative NADPH-quinone reductase
LTHVNGARRPLPYSVAHRLRIHARSAAKEHWFMATHIAIIQGHPDHGGAHFGHALADAYAEAARTAGHEVRRIEVAQLVFPWLRSKQEWERGATPQSILEAQATIGWAGHLVILYPLWLGSMPAVFKAFLEQTFRPGFAIAQGEAGKSWKQYLTGKSARVVVTMGMPAFVYRWYFRAHSLKSLERNILRFCGIGPVRTDLIGMVDAANGTQREKWLEKMRALGRRAS